MYLIAQVIIIDYGYYCNFIGNVDNAREFNLPRRCTMSPAQKRLRELLDKQSHDRQRGLELATVETLDDTQRGELDTIEKRSADTERQLRAARAAVEEEDRQATEKGGPDPAGGDPEMRERIQLRSRCNVGRFLAAALRSRAPDGAEAELQQAAGVDGIPFELWERPAEQRQAEDRAITAAPSSGTGVNLEPLIPQVFSPSIAARLNIDMPMVPSGTFSTARVVHGTDPAAAVASACQKIDIYVNPKNKWCFKIAKNFQVR